MTAPRTITIRPAKPADAPALGRIKVAAWRKAYGQIFPDSFLRGLDYPQQYWDRHLDGLLVSESGRGVTGYCSYAASDVGGWGEIRAIYVTPLAQGLGHGSKLLDSGVAGLAERGFNRALLWVIDRNLEARRFYEAKGWMLADPIRLEDIGGTPVTLVRYDLEPLLSLDL